MKASKLNQNDNQSEILSNGLLELGARRKVFSEGKNNSHEGKVTRFSGKIKDFTSLLKKENASRTGYLCDDDDGRDEQFQNG